MAAVIELEHVTFSYGEEAENQGFIEDLSLSVEEGSFVAVLGHNGSGKSTIAKLLSGLKLPQKGRVFVCGIDTSDEERELEVKKNIGMVFQNPDNQIVATIVEEDVAFGPENLGVEPSEIRRRVDEALAAVGMEEYKDHAPNKLSGGQKQRVAIAGVLAMQPRCMVLDEPTAMLDPRGRGEVMKTILRLREQYGMTIVLITHYMNEAAMADRVVVMDDGRVAADGTPREIFSQVQKLKQLGLDVPQPTELIDQLKQAGIDLPDGILTVDECVQAVTRAFMEE